MEITARQFGRLEAVGYALRKYAEKNDVGTVLVGTLEEVLHEIEAADDLHELDGFLPPTANVPLRSVAPLRCRGLIVKNKTTDSPGAKRGARSASIGTPQGVASAKSTGSRASGEAAQTPPKEILGGIEDLRAYAAEVADQGAGVVAMLRLVKEHFGLDSARFAALLHVRKQSLTDALNRATVSQNLLARVADFFGDGKRAASDCCGTQKSCLDRVGNKPVDWR